MLKRLNDGQNHMGIADVLSVLHGYLDVRKRKRKSQRHFEKGLDMQHVEEENNFTEQLR